MVPSILPQLPSAIIRAAAEAVLFKPGQVLEALVLGKTADGLMALRIADIVINAQLPQTLPPGTMLQLQVKTGSPLPQLVMVGTPQLPATTVPMQPAPALPLPPVLVLPAASSDVQTPVSSAPAAVAPPLAANVAPAPASVPPPPSIAPPTISAQAQPAPTVPSPPQITPMPITESRQPVAATGARIDSSPPSLPAPTSSPAAPAAVATPPSVPPQPSPAVGPSGLPAPHQASAPLPTQAPPSAAPLPAPPVVGTPPLPSVAAPSIVPTAPAPTPLAPAVAGQVQVPPPAAPVAAPTALAPSAAPEPIAPSPLLVAQGATRQLPTMADLPRPTPPGAAEQAQPSPPPATPAAALGQTIPEAMARQNSIAPLLASLAAVVARPGALPEPVLRAALQVLGQRVQLPPGGPTAQVLEAAVAKSGVYLEAGLAKGAPFAGDLKSGLVALKGALATWLGGNPAPVMAARQAAPPLRGMPPRAEAVDLPPLPDAPREAARMLHSQADAALSRVKLMQLASLPDADPVRASVQELRTEVPFLVGQELVMAQFQVFRDGGRRKSGEGRRGWTMRFSMNGVEKGEVGGEIGLLGRSVSVALWAADPDVAASLEAALPELAPALAALGLEPGAVRVRALPPETPKPVSGQYLDSTR